MAVNGQDEIHECDVLVVGSGCGRDGRGGHGAASRP